MQRVRFGCGQSATDQSHSSMEDESGAQHGLDCILPVALATADFSRRVDTSSPATEATHSVREGCQNIRLRFASISLASAAARSVTPEGDIADNNPSGGIKWPWRNTREKGKGIQLINWDLRLPFFKDADPREAMTALNHVYSGTGARTLSQVPIRRNGGR